MQGDEHAQHAHLLTWRETGLEQLHVYASDYQVIASVDVNAAGNDAGIIVGNTRIIGNVLFIAF